VTSVGASYNLETVLAEKLETIITRTTTNIWMRDFYDIHILLQFHNGTIVPGDFHRALAATARKRGTEKYLPNATSIFDEVAHSSVMEKQWVPIERSSHTRQIWHG
jgi:hypothetical protein